MIDLVLKSAGKETFGFNRHFLIILIEALYSNFKSAPDVTYKTGARKTAFTAKLLFVTKHNKLRISEHYRPRAFLTNVDDYHSLGNANLRSG